MATLQGQTRCGGHEDARPLRQHSSPVGAEPRATIATPLTCNSVAPQGCGDFVGTTKLLVFQAIRPSASTARGVYSSCHVAPNTSRPERTDEETSTLSTHFLATSLAFGLAGCAADGAAPAERIQPSERTTSTTQADTVTPPGGKDDSVSKPMPAPHLGPRGSGSAGGSTGGGDGGTATSGPAWQPLVNQSQVVGAGHAMLLTDGTVIAQSVYSALTATGWDLNTWWKLTPDAFGSYVNGTWSQIASLPNGYAPMYYGSAVLPDGRVIIQGGEYQVIDGQPVTVWQTNGAIYDPVKDEWTAVAPPTGWTFIGDAVSTVLADGRFLLSDDWSQTAIFNPASLTWTTYATTGKADFYDEEGWTLLPSGKVLTVDTNNAAALTNSEILDPSTGAWTSAGSTIVKLADFNADGTGSWEMGPQVLRPDGTVFAAGGTGHSAVYDTSCGKWTAGPDFPVVAGGQLDVADGPAALAPNGNVSWWQALASTTRRRTSTSSTARRSMRSPFRRARPTSRRTRPTCFCCRPADHLHGLEQRRGHLSGAEARLSIGRPAHRRRLRALQPRAGQHVPPRRHRPERHLAGGCLRRRLAAGDELPARPHHQRQDGPRVLRAHARPQRHERRSQQASHTFFDVPAGIETGSSQLVVVANGIPSDPVSVRITASAR